MNVRAAWLWIGVAAACGSPPITSVPIDEVETRTDPDVDRGALLRDLESTVIENYSQLTLGNVDAYKDGVSAELPIVLFGIEPRDVVYGTAPSSLSRDRRPYRRFGPAIYSKNLDVHLSRSGAVAWTYDEVSYRVPYLDRRASIPIRITGVYVRDVERWVLVMEHQSYALPMPEIMTMAASGKLPAPARMRNRFFKAEGASALLLNTAGKFLNADAGYERRKLSTAEDALVLLPDPDHEFASERTIEAPTVAELFGEGATVGLRDYRVHVAREKSIGWIAANLVVSTRVNDEPVEIGLRATYLFENRGKYGWEIVQMHVSVPIGLPELTRRVFGTVGEP